MFGFRLKAKSEHEAAQVFGWYGVGTGMVYPYVGVTGRARDVRMVGARYGGGEEIFALRPKTATRHAASLRPPRNGRIGFKPPYSKRETAAEGPYGQAFLGDPSYG